MVHENKFLTFILILFSLLGKESLSQPSWSVNPNLFDYSMTITGKIRIEGINSLDMNDMVAAFSGDECCGVTKVKYQSTLKDYFVFLMIYCNRNSQPINFKIFDSSENLILDVATTISFSINGIIGSVSNPFVFDGGFEIISEPIKTYEANVLDFSIPGQIGSTLIDNSNIIIEIESSINLSELTPNFTISEGAKAYVNNIMLVSESSIIDFREPVQIKIQPKEGEAKYYLVSISKKYEAKVLSFTVPGQIGSSIISDSKIELKVGSDYILDNIIANFSLSDGAKAYIENNQFESGMSQLQYTSPFELRIEPHEGNHKVYTVEIHKEYEAKILNLSVSGQKKPSIITGNNISLILPSEVELNNLIINFQLSEGARIFDGDIQLFSGISTINGNNQLQLKIIPLVGEPVFYNILISKAKEIKFLSFEIPGQIGYPKIEQNSIELYVGMEEDLNYVKASFKLPDGCKVYVNNIVQESGISINNFNSTLQYKIVPEQGEPIYYTINIKRKYQADFLSISIPGIEGDAIIGFNTIQLKVSTNTNISNAIANFRLTKGAKAYINNVLQISGITSNDFTEPVDYMVISSEGEIKFYRVTVFKEYEAKILSFYIPGQTGPTIINDTNIIITQGLRGDLTNVIAGFTLSDGARAYVDNKFQTSESTENDFSSIVRYLIVPKEGNPRYYSVSVIRFQEVYYDLILSNSSFYENQDSILIGNLEVISNTSYGNFKFSLPDTLHYYNSYFYIENNKLYTKKKFNFELLANIPVSIRAIDNFGNSVIKNYELKLLNANDPPTGLSLSNYLIDSVVLAKQFVARINVSDEDANDKHCFELIDGNGKNDTGNSFFQIKNDSLILSNTNFDKSASNIRILIRVKDQENAFIEKEFVLQVKSQNHIPEFLSDTVCLILQNQLFFYFINIRDIDNDKLNIEIFNKPNWLFYNENLFFLYGIPDNSNVGELEILLKVNDGKSVIEQKLKIKVENINDRPIKNQNIRDIQFLTGHDNYFQLPLNCIVDPDIGDKLDFQIYLENNAELPYWLKFNQETFTISGNPTTLEIGQYQIKLVATDEGKLSEFITFYLEVSLPTNTVKIEGIKSVSIFPNPVIDLLYCNLDYTSIKSKIAIYSIEGKFIKEEYYYNVNSFSISLGNLKSGNYLIEYSDGNQSIIKKFVKK